MKNINKGLGYLAVAAISIAVIAFTKDLLSVIAIVLGGFYLVNKADSNSYSDSDNDDD